MNPPVTIIRLKFAKIVKAAAILQNLTDATAVVSKTVPLVLLTVAMTTPCDLATTYEDWARQSDEIANSIFARLSRSNPEAQIHQLAKVNALREEAERLREHAERLRGKHPDSHKV
jgi:hypothetical protein